MHTFLSYFSVIHNLNIQNAITIGRVYVVAVYTIMITYDQCLNIYIHA